MEIPGSVAPIWHYEEVAQWALKNVVCRRTASIVSVFALAIDAYWPCLIKDVVERRVVQHHIVLSLFARERIFGFDLGLLLLQGLLSQLLFVNRRLMLASKLRTEMLATKGYVQVGDGLDR